MTTDPTQKIADRRRFISEQVAKLQREIDSYAAESAELDVAERVYKRFSGEPTLGSRVEKSASDANAAPAYANGHDVEDESDVQDSGPTLPEMVNIILDEAKATGRKGVDSSEMLKIIQDRWKPNMTPDQVRPTLWRLVKKQKKLRKRGRLYFRVEDNSDPQQGQPDVVKH